MKHSALTATGPIVRIATLVTFLFACAGDVALAQSSQSPDRAPTAPPSVRPNDQDRPAQPLPDRGVREKSPAPTPDKQGAGGAKKPQLGKVVPDSPGERAKLLDDLYAHLATAPDDEASKPFVEAIERVWLTPGSDTISALMERALQSVNKQRNDLALQLLSAVVDLAPDYAEGWNRRAYVFYTEGDYERALGDLRRVLALDANHYKALDGVGQIMRQLGRKPQALQTYERLLAIHPAWPNIQTTVDELRREVEGRAL